MGHTIAVNSYMFPLDTKLVHSYLALVLSSFMYLYLIYVVAVIGFNQTAYTFEEGDGTVEVCAVFLDPGQTAPNVVVELMGSISPSTYHTCCVNVLYFVVTQRAPMHGQSTF